MSAPESRKKTRYNKAQASPLDVRGGRQHESGRRLQLAVLPPACSPRQLSPRSLQLVPSAGRTPGHPLPQRTPAPRGRPGTQPGRLPVLPELDDQPAPFPVGFSSRSRTPARNGTPPGSRPPFRGVHARRPGRRRGVRDVLSTRGSGTATAP